jgi:hypothetical protein
VGFGECSSKCLVSIKVVNLLTSSVNINFPRPTCTVEFVTVGDVPEELKLSVMECVTCLLKQASSDVICEFYSREHAPKLGQGIYIAIQMAQWEKLRPLRYKWLFYSVTFQY